MEENKKFLNNVNNLFISKVIIKLLKFLLIPIYTRYLTTFEYGSIDIIETTVNILIPVFTLGINEAVLRFTLDKKARTLKIGLIINLISYFIIGIIAIILNNYFFNYQYITVLIIYYISTALFDLMYTYVQGLDKTKKLINASIIGFATSLILTIVFILDKKININTYFISIIAANLISSAVFIIESLKINSKEYNEQVNALEMIKYGIPFIITSITWGINTSFDKYIITAFNGTKQNGIYSAATKIPYIFTFISNSIIKAIQISIIDAYKKRRLEESFKRFYKGYHIIGTFVVSIIIIFSNFITKIMLGVDFYEAWKYIGILTIASLINGELDIAGTVFITIKQSKIIAKTTAIGALINIVLNIIVIPKLGILGASITTLISYFVILFIRIWKINKMDNIKIKIGKFIIGYIVLIIQVTIFLLISGIIGYVLQLVIIGILLLLYGKEMKIIIKNLF